MNLVQINERLKDLPLQAVQQYANGMNPEVPPYLALSELQRRQAQQQQMSNAQGQGPMPSVKEQIEQKAGLLALQQAQMQQQQSQMMQPRPGPVPAGIPQAEPQPQAMAGGGIARIPVRDDLYQFAGGGIIAFQSGGGTDVQRILKKHPRERTPEENAILERAGIKLQRQQIPQDSAIRKASEALGEIGPGIRSAITAGTSGMTEEELAAQPAAGGAMNERILRALGASQVTPKPPAPPQPSFSVPSEARLSAGVPALQQPAGLAALAGARPTAQAQPAARPAQPAPQPAPQQQMPQAMPVTPPAEQTLEMPKSADVISQVNQLAPAAMQEDAMQKRAAEQRARAEQERAAFERTRPSGLDELIRVFGQAGQYKGLSGTGPAYTAMQQQKRAEELAMEKRQNELLTAIEGREVGEAKELFGARTNQFDRMLKANTEAFREKGANERLAKQQAHDLTLQQVRMQNEKEIAKIKFDYEQRLRSMPTAEERLRNQAIADYQKMFPGTDRLTAQKVLGFIGTPAERGPSPTDRLRAAQSMLENAETDTERAMAKSEIARIMGGSQPQRSTTPPAVGTVMDGYRFKGGNPADSKNWEKV